MVFAVVWAFVVLGEVLVIWDVLPGGAAVVSVGSPVVAEWIVAVIGVVVVEAKK